MEVVPIFGSSMIETLGLGLGPVGTPVPPPVECEPAPHQRDPRAIDLSRRALFIRFKSDGAIYRFDDERIETVFHALQGAESAGKFFHAFVRNKYPTARLPGDCDPFANGVVAPSKEAVPA